MLLSAALAAFAAGNALAASSEAVRAGEARVRLLASGLSNTNSAPVFRGGVEIVLTPGWKTYWRYPGDAGIPPRFDWSASENVASVDVFYPAPMRITDGSGQTSIGYEEHVIFPLRIHPKDASRPVVLHLKFDFATCEKLCIPAEVTLSLSVKVGEDDEPALASAEQRVPKRIAPKDSPTLAKFEARVHRGKDADGKNSRIIVKVLTGAAGKLDLFAEGPSEEWTLALPQLLKAEQGYSIFSIPLDGSRLGKAEIPPKLILTLIAGERAFETEVPLD